MSRTFLFRRHFAEYGGGPAEFMATDLPQREMAAAIGVFDREDEKGRERRHPRPC